MRVAYLIICFFIFLESSFSTESPEKMLEVKEGKSIVKDCRIDREGAQKWKESKGMMCTMALVPMVCPSRKGIEFVANDGCVANYHRRFGWKIKK